MYFCNSQRKTFLFLALFIVTALAIGLSRQPVQAQSFDYDEAAEVQAVRWQAMTDFYARNEMLIDTFDYDEAAAVQAVRWQAMANFYEKVGMLTSVETVQIR